MARAKDLALVARDTRLSPEARIIVLDVACRGDGEHEIGYIELRSLLSQRGEKVVRRAVAEAELHGWLRVNRKVGSGLPRFAFCPAISDRQTGRDSDDLPSQNGQADDAPALPKWTGREGDGDSAPEILPTQNGQAEKFCPAKEGRQASRARDRARDRTRKEEKKEVDTPSIISPAAERAIADNAEKLSGCRGALRDYVIARVPIPRQSGYVFTIVGWLDGIDATVFRRPDGTQVPVAERTALLANALNELAGSDETAMKRPVGDPANLRTKINALLRGTVQAPAPRTATTSRPAASSSRTPQTYDYSNATNEFRGFKL